MFSVWRAQRVFVGSPSSSDATRPSDFVPCATTSALRPPNFDAIGQADRSAFDVLFEIFDGDQFLSSHAAPTAQRKLSSWRAQERRYSHHLRARRAHIRTPLTSVHSPAAIVTIPHCSALALSQSTVGSSPCGAALISTAQLGARRRRCHRQAEDRQLIRWCRGAAAAAAAAQQRVL